MTHGLEVKITRRRIVPLLAISTLIACNSPKAHQALESLGLSDGDPPPPAMVDLICDSSKGSSCTSETVNAVLNVALPYASIRSDSSVRFWAQGSAFGDTRLAGSQKVGRPSKPGKKSQNAYEIRWVDNARDYFAKAVEPYLARPGASRSPIAEGISKVALAGGAPGFARLLVVISDAREVSQFGDFECGPVPSGEKFTRALLREGVLMPGSLTGAKVHFAFVTEGEVDGQRCGATVGRATQVRALWLEALTRAGAAEVSFSGGVPSLGE